MLIDPLVQKSAQAMTQRSAQAMTMAALKLGLLAVFGVITLGIFPNKVRGGVLAIGTCVAAAVVLHFVRS